MITPSFFHSVNYLLVVIYLTGADGAPVLIQHPNLPVVLHLSIMKTVACAVFPVRTPAVIASVHVKAHRVVSTAVPTCLTFIDIYKTDHKHRVMSGQISV